MSIFKRKGIRLAIAVYWFLLAYMIAALVWWFISLQKQNREMTVFRQEQLKSAVDSLVSPLLYTHQLNQIEEKEKMNTAKYVGEGVTFLALILVGAVFVYGIVRRQMKLQQQQQNFMMAVTHELKTPIAVAKLNLETLQKHQLDDLKREKLIRMTLQETNRLNTLANNILVSSQLENDKYRIAKEELDLSELVKKSLHDFRLRFTDRKWEEAIDPEVDLAGDDLLLQMLVNNLLENAVKYSPAEGMIGCSLHRKGNKIYLQVSDEGPGIPADEKKKIFDKFYRIGNENTRTAKGTGLGLYLCSKIAKDHNAAIRVTDNTPSGSNFTVIFSL